MAVLELLLVAVSHPAMLLLLAAQVARASARQPEPLAVQVVHLALLALQVLHLLLVDYSGKAVEVVVVVPLALAVLAELEVVALAAVAVVQHAVRTRPALVVSVVLAGHWYWSFDHAAIRCC